MFLPHPLIKFSIVGSLRDREVACSASSLQGLHFESCVWRAVSSYCNSLLYGLPDTLIKQLQRVQNACARMVMKFSKGDHITPLLKELHSLPVHARIEYKIIFLTFKCLNNLALAYLADLITLYHPARSLLSADKRLLVVHPSGKKHYKNRSFAYAAPLLWSQLPEHMRLIDSTAHFKTVLRTFFFTRVFY